jgi:hypothetical protein
MLPRRSMLLRSVLTWFFVIWERRNVWVVRAGRRYVVVRVVAALVAAAAAFLAFTERIGFLWLSALGPLMWLPTLGPVVRIDLSQGEVTFAGRRFRTSEFRGVELTTGLRTARTSSGRIYAQTWRVSLVRRKGAAPIPVLAGSADLHVFRLARRLSRALDVPLIDVAAVDAHESIPPPPSGSIERRSGDEISWRFQVSRSFDRKVAVVTGLASVACALLLLGTARWIVALGWFGLAFLAPSALMMLWTSRDHGSADLTLSAHNLVLARQSPVLRTRGVRVDDVRRVRVSARFLNMSSTNGVPATSQAHLQLLDEDDRLLMRIRADSATVTWLGRSVHARLFPQS